jgi:hypothetical protein
MTEKPKQPPRPEEPEMSTDELLKRRRAHQAREAAQLSPSQRAKQGEPTKD